MQYIVGMLLLGGSIRWEYTGDWPRDGEGLTLSFPLHSKANVRKAESSMLDAFQANNITWLRKRKKIWVLSADVFRREFNDIELPSWFTGQFSVDLELEDRWVDTFGKQREETTCRFVITPELLEEQMSKKIFLSHKGVDNPLIREYKNSLEIIGLSPWLDEDSLLAGASLERGLVDGFEQSCAAVFFITPNFVDEKYLASEIEYAIAQKRKKEDKFSIISLLLRGQNEQRGVVPKLLQPFVWKEPNSHLEGFYEIVRALPLKVDEVGWKNQ